MSYDENRISDLIDGGIQQQEELFKTPKKGFIEVQERYYSPSSEKWVNLNGKTSLNITHIVGFKENNIHTKPKEL